MKTFDAILAKIGPFGTYQKYILFIFGLYSIAVCCFSFMLFIFLGFGAKDSYECDFPKSLLQSLPEGMNMTALHCADSELTQGGATPWCSVCDFSASNWTAYSPDVNRSVYCPFGYRLVESQYSETVISKFGLVCDKVMSYTNILTIHYAGAAIGGIVWSPLQDKLGRKRLIQFEYIFVTLVGILIAFAPNVQILTVSAFLIGLQNRLSFPLAWMYCQEWTDIDHQSLVLAVCCSGFAAGGFGIALVAYFAPTWHAVVVAMVAGHAVLIIPSFFLEESPRWLLSVGKVAQAKKIIRNVMRVNRVFMETPEILEMEEIIDREFSEKAVHSGSFTFTQLFTNGWSIVIKVLVLSYQWIACMMVYTGVTVNAEGFAINPIIIFAVTNAVELPAALALNLSNYVGRIPITFSSFLMSGVFSLVTIAGIRMDSMYFTIFCVFMLKFFITLAWDSTCLTNAEEFPTAIRATALGLPNILSVTASMTLPIIVFQGTTDFSVPMIVFAAMSFVAALLCLTMPETAHRPLIDTVADEKDIAVTPMTVFNNVKSLLTCGSETRERRRNKKEREAEEMLDG